MLLKKTPIKAAIRFYNRQLGSEKGKLNERE